MKDKRKVYQAAKKLGFVDFLARMSQATGKFESCEIDVLQERQWVSVAGYKSTFVTHKIRTLRYASSVSSRRRFCIVETDSEEVWCDESCVRSGYVTIEVISPYEQKQSVEKIVPITGF